MIENSIEHLNQCNAVGSIREIYTLGGVNDGNFLQFEKALLSIKTDFTNLKPINPKVNSSDLQSFMECIKYKYINVTMNYADNNVDYEDIDNEEMEREQVISDITIVSNKKAQPPLLSLAQYFEKEDKLSGSARMIKSSIIYLYDFYYNNLYELEKKSKLLFNEIINYNITLLAVYT